MLSAGLVAAYGFDETSGTTAAAASAVFSNAEVVISSIRPSDPVNLRDRAIIGMMVYAGATPKEIAAIRTYDYLANNEWCCIKLGRSRLVEVPKPLHLLMREYLRAATPDEHAPLFRVDSSRSMTPANIQRMIKRRLDDLSAGQGAGRHAGDRETSAESAAD